MKIYQFLFLEIVIAAAIIYGFSLIVKIIRMGPSKNILKRLILPLIGMSILIFYFFRILNQLSNQL